MSSFRVSLLWDGPTSVSEWCCRVLDAGLGASLTCRGRGVQHSTGEVQQDWKFF